DPGTPLRLWKVRVPYARRDAPRAYAETRRGPASPSETGAPALAEQIHVLAPRGCRRSGDHSAATSTCGSVPRSRSYRSAAYPRRSPHRPAVHTPARSSLERSRAAPLNFATTANAPRVPACHPEQRCGPAGTLGERGASKADDRLAPRMHLVATSLPNGPVNFSLFGPAARPSRSYVFGTTGYKLRGSRIPDADAALLTLGLADEIRQDLGITQSRLRQRSDRAMGNWLRLYHLFRRFRNPEHA